MCGASGSWYAEVGGGAGMLSCGEEPPQHEPAVVRRSTAGSELPPDAFCPAEAAENSTRGIQFVHVIDQTKGSAFHTACQREWAAACTPDPPPHGGIEPCGFVAIVVAEILAQQPATLSVPELNRLVGLLRDPETMMPLVRAAMRRTVEARREYIRLHPEEFASDDAKKHWTSGWVGQWEVSRWVRDSERRLCFLRNIQVGPSEGHPDAAFRYSEAAFSDDPSIVREWLAEEADFRGDGSVGYFMQRGGELLTLGQWQTRGGGAPVIVDHRGHYACYLVALVEGNMMLLRFDSSKDGDQSEQGKAMLQPVCSAVACTGRLLLRALLPEDAEALHRVIFADAEVMHFGDGVQDLEWTQRWIRSEGKAEEALAHGARPCAAPWAVVLRDTNELIGYCGLFSMAVHSKPEMELGYRLGRNYWGQGLATEAAHVAVDYARNVLGIQRLISLIDPSNTRSAAVAKKLGMTKESEVMCEGYDHPDDVYSRAL